MIVIGARHKFGLEISTFFTNRDGKLSDMGPEQIRKVLRASFGRSTVRRKRAARWRVFVFPRVL